MKNRKRAQLNRQLFWKMLDKAFVTGIMKL